MMTGRNYALNIIVFFLAVSAYATPQVRTPLLLNGTNYYVKGFSLRPDMEKTYESNRHKIRAVSTNNRKGYSETLEIRGQELYLTTLEIRRGDGWFQFGPSVKTVFGTTIPKGGMRADWFTGELHEAIGEPMIPHTGITEFIRVYTFDNGNYTGVHVRKTDYAIKLEQEIMNAEQAGPGYPSQGVGSP